jgi:hypothetical protein
VAGGREYTRYQKGIINRYFQHKDAILVTRLQELTSELYLAEGKKADQLWTRAEKALVQLKTEPEIPEKRKRAILDGRDVGKLAELLNELATR